MCLFVLSVPFFVLALSWSERLHIPAAPNKDRQRTRKGESAFPQSRRENESFDRLDLFFGNHRRDRSQYMCSLSNPPSRLEEPTLPSMATGPAERTSMSMRMLCNSTRPIRLNHPTTVGFYWSCCQCDAIHTRIQVGISCHDCGHDSYDCMNCFAYEETVDGEHRSC